MFYGVLKDKELYMIEDALNSWAGDKKEIKEEALDLVQKLYSKFTELPTGCNISIKKEERIEKGEIEDEILDLIDNQDDFTRSDLQGAVGALVKKIIG